VLKYNYLHKYLPIDRRQGKQQLTDRKNQLSWLRKYLRVTVGRTIGKTIGATVCGVVSTIALTLPGQAAERIAFYYAPFGEFTISTDSLEKFAKEGKITDDFDFYAGRLSQQQLTQLRELLETRFQVSTTLVSQFTYSPIGVNLLKRLGDLLLTDSRQNGFYAIRSAFILSAADREGLTLVNVIRRYPSPTIRLNLGETLGIVDNLSGLLKRRDITVTRLKQIAQTEAANETKIDFGKQPDLRRVGTFKSQKISLELDDTSRKRQFAVDLYLPFSAKPPVQSPVQPSPVIVISHGVAESRETFAYAAQHLVSYGFAVAVLEHPGSDSKKFQQYFSGFAGPPEAEELINRPLDVKFLLDELQRRSERNENLKGRLNLQQVGAIGHSLGGYTALTLASGNLNFPQLRKDCFPNRSLNLSVFLQCRGAELPPINYSLSDPRIKAVMALNPLNSTIIGKTGLSKIKIPVMLVGGSQDIFTPAVPEQIRPFTWLRTGDKYLAIIENGTHFSVSEDLKQEENILPVPESLIGPNPAIAQTYIKALSVAFFQTYLSNQQEYRPYLSASYAQFITQEPLNLSLVKSLSEEQFTQIYNGKNPPIATPNNSPRP
jgi:predicted dienelactone hydrolase